MSANRLLRAEVIKGTAWLVSNGERIAKTPFDQISGLILELQAHLGRDNISRGTFRRLCRDAGVALPNRLKPVEVHNVEHGNLEEKIDRLISSVDNLVTLLKGKLFG